MTIIYDVILNRDSKALPDVIVFYDGDIEKVIDKMGECVKQSDFNITTKNGKTIRRVVLREREATGKELRFRLIETRGLCDYEVCKRAQSVCNHNCNSCAWNENK